MTSAVDPSVTGEPTGLTELEAQARLNARGPNEVGIAPVHGLSRLLAPLLMNPLVAVLLFAAAVSASLGDRTNAAIIVTIVLLSLLLDWFQTRRSQKAAEALRSTIAPTATVLRDGKWRKVMRREVVVGDVVRLSAGDLVPADGRLLTEKDLHINEAVLTGESMPAEKEVGTGDERERVLLGTSVVSGTATMLVEKTGSATEFGQIELRLAERAPETEFERGLRDFGVLIMRLVVLLTGFVIVAMLGLKRPPLESFMFAVALAVGLTPEFLPMITTLTLTRGAMRMARHQVIVKRLAAIQNFGSMDVLCSDKTGTLTSGQMTLDASLDLAGAKSDSALKWACLNSHFESGIASPLDAAILQAASAEAGWSKVDEIPFDFERRRLSIVSQSDERRVLISKGSPESVWSICKPASFVLSEQQALIDSLGKQGFRILAVAIRDVPEQKAYGIEDEKDLELLGYLTFADPPLHDALGAVERLRAAGIDLKILTGDSDAVTRHVCREIGLDPGQIVVGSEIDALSDEALRSVAEKTLVFARATPAQKNRVLLALKAHGHVVGYMGDGINDAPALHSADVGISFADGTDVAKDAAQIILVERHLGRLLDAVYEGRMAFGNVMKYLLMGTSSSFGNMLSMAAASVFLPFLPMLPTQILLNNLLYDVSQVPIPLDHVDESYIRQPKRWDMRQIRNFMLLAGPISSLYDGLTFLVLIYFFRVDEKHFHTGWFLESLLTQTLVIFVIRTRFRPWQSRPSRFLVATMLAVIAFSFALPYTPLAGALGFVPMTWQFYAFVAIACLTYLALVEGVKRALFPVLPGATVAPSKS